MFNVKKIFEIFFAIWDTLTFLMYNVYGVILCTILYTLRISILLKGLTLSHIKFAKDFQTIMRKGQVL